MPERTNPEAHESSPRGSGNRQTARRGRPFSRRAYAAREAVNSLLVDQIADTIILALQVIERIARVYTRIPGHQDLVRALGLIYALLTDLREAFTPV